MKYSYDSGRTLVLTSSGEPRGVSFSPKDRVIRALANFNACSIKLRQETEIEGHGHKSSLLTVPKMENQVCDVVVYLRAQSPRILRNCLALLPIKITSDRLELMQVNLSANKNYKSWKKSSKNEVIAYTKNKRY